MQLNVEPFLIYLTLFFNVIGLGVSVGVLLTTVRQHGRSIDALQESDDNQWSTTREHDTPAGERIAFASHLTMALLCGAKMLWATCLNNAGSNSSRGSRHPG